MKTNIPSNTNILIKGNKIKNEFQNLISILIDNKIILNRREDCVRAFLIDVCSILYYFDKNENENTYEYLLVFIIVVESLKLSNKDDVGASKIDAINLISNWNKQTPKTKDLVFQIIKDFKQNITNGQVVSILSECNYSGELNEVEFQKIKNAYRIFLFNLSYAIISIDGEITPKEKEAIDKYNVFISSCVPSSQTSGKMSSEKKTEYLYISTNKSDKSFEDIMSEIDALVGMDNVKREVKQLINFVKVNKLREERGLNKVEISLHSVFSGPPGTGKTTVARLLAEAYKSIGILKSGHLIETDRASLVAGYVGQTAIKTKEILESALDGLLFIDEAYMLSNGDDGYGQEAIDTLLKYMEDNRSRLIVIAAGYENEMFDFINSNPGLKSRFNKYINFKNYSPEELLEIFLRLTIKNRFTLNSTAKDLVYENLILTYNNNKNFGNARYVRNLFESIIQKQFERIAYIENPSEDVLSTIEEQDVSV